MVRVVSVHHFDSQSIQICEDALAVCTASRDRLLIALPHHAIEVRDLSGNQSSYSFPTVDKVSFLSYCSTGNYVATVEEKFSRQEKRTYTRVYANWESGRGEDQPMRARIAGQVTPSSSQTGGDVLEMIELPSRLPKITAITPCQETGNVLIGCEGVLCLFQLVTRTHDISRLKFLDFEQWPVTLELSFSPTHLAMSEDVVAAMNDTSTHVFRLNKGFARASDWSSQAPNTSQKRHKRNGKRSDERRERSPVDVERLLKEVSDGVEEGEEVGRECSKLANGPLPVLALLPSLRSGRSHDPARNLRVSPFKPPGSVTMGVAIKEIPANEPWAEQMTTMVESLLQLELGEWDEESTDRFVCLALRPLYTLNRTLNGKMESSCPKLRSSAYSSLVAFNCFVSTQQEGFMYHFPVEEGEVLSLGKCISEYNFTSPVKCIVLEPSILHAITTSGLETYTLRTVNAIYEDSDTEACPSTDEPVCLLGLRPFIGVVDLLLSKSYVIILSSADSISKKRSGGEVTIYSLALPPLDSLYRELLYSGSAHRLNSPTAYCQMVEEAHTLLRAAVSLTSSHLSQPLLGHHLHLYRESCALLADYYLICETEEDWEKGYKYSMMAGLTPIQVMDRLNKLEIDSKEAGLELNSRGGLGYYLKECLIRCDEEASLPASALSRLLELAQGGHSCIVSSLVLQSSILRQFSTETSIRLLSKRLRESDHVDVQDCLALCILYISRGKINDACHVLRLVENQSKELVDILLKYWTLLFDSLCCTNKKTYFSKEDWENVTLSELSVLLIEKRPQDLAAVLSSLITENSVLQLEDVLQVFLTYLPSRMVSGSCSVTRVLQMFLEDVFCSWHSIDPNWAPQPDHPPTTEALKILMRSYLTDLVKTGQSADHGAEEPPHGMEAMFGGKRPHFLEMLPPFSHPHAHPSYFVSLLKLQCLLCTGWLEESILSELVQFVSEFVPEEVGFSLLVLSQPGKAVHMVATHYPIVLPLYAQEMLKSEPEWKHLIATIQSLADEEGTTEGGSKIYPRVLEEVLNELARRLNCEVFARVVPPGKEFEGYLLTCQRFAHASHLQDVIKVTGHKLLASLNLKSFT